MARRSQEGCVQDELEQRGASDGVLKTWMTAETKALRLDAATSTSKSHEPQVCKLPSLATRSKAITTLNNLLAKFDPGQDQGKFLDMKTWFQAGLLFDVYCVRSPNPLDVHSIPIVCAVLVRLCQKFDTKANLCTNAKLSKLVAGSMDELLIEAADDNTENVSEDDIKETELVVLTSLQYRLSMPTLPDWITLIASRLDTLTCGQFRQSITPIWSFCSHLASLFVWHCPASADHPPRRLAQGLVCLACVASGVLPDEAFDLRELECLSDWPWSSLSQASQLSFSSRKSVLLAALLAATSAECVDLQKDAKVVNDLELLLRTAPLANNVNGLM